MNIKNKYQYYIVLRPMTHCLETSTKKRYQKTRTGFSQVCREIR